MKRLFVLLVLSAVLFSSCRKVIGHGPVETEMRPVNDFTGISADFSGYVNLTIEPVFRLEVRAQENVLDVLETKVVNGILEIKFKHGTSVTTNREITVNVSAPTADYLHMGGSGRLHVIGHLATGDLETSVNGSGKLEMDEATVSNLLEAKVSGSGDNRIYGGSIKNANLSVSGSGGIDIYEALTEKADAHVSGSGYITLNVSQTLNANISGSGMIRYGGNPVVNSNVSGSGKVKPI